MLKWWEAKRALVKQIRNGELLGTIMDRGDSYFHWLQEKSGLSGPLSSMLAETKFISVDGIDDVLLEKAKEEVRQTYTSYIREKDGLDDKDAETVYKSIRGDCCLFEVILCLSFSLNEMFEDLDAYDGPSHFFGILMKNCGLDLYDEEDFDTIGEQVKNYWRRCIDRIIMRSYEDSGKGGLFPLEWVEDYRDDRKTYPDQRLIPLWQQMNNWVDQHTNEDGEWVD